MTNQRLLGIILVVFQAAFQYALANVGDIGAPPYVKYGIGIVATAVTVAAFLIDPNDDSSTQPHG